MNHLKFVRILKTTEIPGIYETYLLILTLFELIFYVNSNMGISPSPSTFPFGYTIKHILCIISLSLKNKRGPSKVT